MNDIIELLSFHVLFARHSSWISIISTDFIWVRRKKTKKVKCV